MKEATSRPSCSTWRRLQAAVVALTLVLPPPCTTTAAFVHLSTRTIVARKRPAFVLLPFDSSTTESTPKVSSTSLWAKKKNSPSSAALEALEALGIVDEEPLSKKELLALQKKKQKKTDGAEENGNAATVNGVSPKGGMKMSKKDEMLAKALAVEESIVEPISEPETGKKLNKKQMLAKALETESELASPVADTPKAMNKKDARLMKALEFEKLENVEAKEVNGAVSAKAVNGQAATPAVSSPTKSRAPGFEKSPEQLADEALRAEEALKPSLEDKIRKERPPPRIRVMESSQPGYVSLRLENVGVTFRNQEVLKDVTWGVQTGDRLGLVGANGAGKTTQLRILAGELEPTTGDVVKSGKDLRVAILRQEFIDELVPERTLREEFLSIFEVENSILKQIKDSEKALETADPTESKTMQEILDRMEELQKLAEDKEVYVLESRIKKVMDLMGFTEDEGEDLVASFSGGWKMRIGLGKTLLKDPNVLLLDEPTNHLDLESVEWMESFLRQQNIPMIIVSHDREFLDQVCTKIVDAEGGMCTEYDGNYSRFLQLKKSRMDAWQAAYNAQEKKIKEEKAWINKFKLKQPQAVKQREAKVEKLLTSSDYVKKPPFLGKPFKFRFPEGPRLSPEVALIESMSHGYRNEQTQNRLFDCVDLFIERGDRVAVVGPNGSGKSTLLRLLTGKEKPDIGRAEIVGQNVVMNYFEQNQADALDLDMTVLETIQANSNGQSYNELRAYLGQFLFKGDSVDKQVRSLSGGEKARLSLCCMMLRPANFLILDEPTNHLDIPAKEMLEEALQHYTGAVMIVSHDRFFISRVANSIVAIEDRKLVKYQGDYRFYLDKSQEFRDRVEARYVAGVQRIESAPVIDLDELQKPKKNFGGAKTANLVTRKDKGIKNAKRMQPN